MSAAPPLPGSQRDAILRSLREAARRPRHGGPRSGAVAVIELSRCSLRGLIAVAHQGALRLERFFGHEAPVASWSDPSARCRDLGLALGRFLASARARDFVLVLSTDGIRTAVVEIPPLSPEDSADALWLKAQKRIGASAEEWQVRALPLGAPAGAGAPKHLGPSHLIAVAPDCELMEMAEVCRHAGRIPSLVTIPPVLYPLLLPDAAKAGDSPEDEAPVWVVTEIRREITSVYIYSRGALQYSRHISIGGAHFTAALTDVLATQKGIIELSIEEAEALKRQVGFPPDASPLAPAAGRRLTNEQIRLMLEPKLRSLVFELRNSIRHFQQKSGRRSIHRLVLTGGGSKLKGLDDYVQEDLKIRPYRFQPEDLQVPLGALEANDAAALGIEGLSLCAALRRPRPALNFSSPRMRWERKVRTPCRVITLASAVAAITFCVLGLRIREGVAWQAKALEALEESRAFAAEIDRQTAEVEEIKVSIARLTSGLGQAIPLAELLADFTRRTPPGATLTQVSVVDEGGNHSVALEGRLTSSARPDVQPAALLVEAFGASPFVKSLRLGSLDRRAGKGTDTFAFTLEIVPYLRPPEVHP
jgi:type IV pilus assembly PilM-like protein